MVRTFIEPTSDNFNISIAKKYIGKKLEVIYFEVDELQIEKPFKNQNLSRFRGLLNEEEADKLQEYVSKSRQEWDRNF
jgi:hypothetical protein